jgi:hypothetical protein
MSPIKFLSSLCLWTIFRITFSYSWSVMGKRLVGSKFWANFGSLPDLGKIIAVSSFQDDGKYGKNKSSWRNWWIPRISTTNDPQKRTSIPYKVRLNRYANYRTLAEKRNGAFYLQDILVSRPSGICDGKGWSKLPGNPYRQGETPGYSKHTKKNRLVLK